MTCDMWHMTRDMWHVTRDMWHVTCCGGWTFSQNFSSLAFTVCDLRFYEDLEEKAHGLTDLINNKAVCRTAPATPGLLNTHGVLLTDPLEIHNEELRHYESLFEDLPMDPEYEEIKIEKEKLFE